jgi:hypothetical protein
VNRMFHFLSVISAKEVDAVVRATRRRRRKDVPRTKILKRICLEEEGHRSRHDLAPNRRLGARVAVATPKDHLPSTRGHLPSSGGHLPSSRGHLPSTRDRRPSARDHLPGTAARVNFVKKRAAREAVPDLAVVPRLLAVPSLAARRSLGATLSLLALRVDGKKEESSIALPEVQVANRAVEVKEKGRQADPVVLALVLVPAQDAKVAAAVQNQTRIQCLDASLCKYLFLSRSATDMVSFVSNSTRLCFTVSFNN